MSELVKECKIYNNNNIFCKCLVTINKTLFCIVYVFHKNKIITKIILFIYLKTILIRVENWRFYYLKLYLRYLKLDQNLKFLQPNILSLP